MRKFQTKKRLRKQIAELQETVDKYEKSWRRERDELLIKCLTSTKKTEHNVVKECPRCGHEAYVLYHGYKPRCFTCNYPHMPEPLAEIDSPEKLFEKKDFPKMNQENKNVD